jgi:hypothetical protein
MAAAPIEAIRRGDVPMAEAEKWIIEVKECNWAGNRPPKKKSGGGEYNADPIGNAEPEKTARTRAVRRCATNAFAAYMDRFDEQIRKAENAIEAEWEIVVNEDNGRALPAGPQAVSTGNGEPERGNATGARPLPVEGEPVNGTDDDGPDHEVVQDERAAAAQPATPAAAPSPPADTFDRADAIKRLFASLADHDDTLKKDPARKKWAKANNLAPSTKEWSKADFDRAQELLVGPYRDGVLRTCEATGQNLEDLSLAVLGRSAPDYLRHWKLLAQALEARGAAVGAEGEGDL